MKHLKRLFSRLILLVFAVGFIPAAVAAETQQSPTSVTLSEFSALWWAKIPSPSNERRIQEMEKFFGKKSYWEPPTITMSFGDTDTVLHFRKEIWAENLGALKGSSSKMSLESAKFAYTYKTSNIFRSISNGSALNPFILFVEKKFSLFDP